MLEAMRYLIAVLAMSLCLLSQTTDQPGSEYASYTMLLVPQNGGGYMIAVDKQQKLAFIPIPSISKAINEDGVLPVRYGDLLQLVRQLNEENQRLKTENEHLWKVAENRSSPTPVIVQEQATPPDPNATRRQAQLMLLRSLLTQRSTVNVNVTDCSRTPALCTGR
jgi:regulator of replication initiation timing